MNHNLKLVFIHSSLAAIIGFVFSNTIGFEKTVAATNSLLTIIAFFAIASVTALRSKENKQASIAIYSVGYLLLSMEMLMPFFPQGLNI